MKTEPHLWVVEQFIEGEWVPLETSVYINRGFATERAREIRARNAEFGIHRRYRVVKYQRVPR